VPEGIVSTGWPAVEARCREWGDDFDEYQLGLGRVVLGKRADGMYAATVGGITWSMPRQVTKTFLVGRIVFALCTLFPGLRVVWTAHHTRTSTNTFRNLQELAKRPEVSPYLADDRSGGLRQANGEQEIHFANGSLIMFGARENGLGRGLDRIDIEVFDEAQILTLKSLENMIAATSRTTHPHGALLFYLGTPPRPIDPGEVFIERRVDALAHKRVDKRLTKDFGPAVEAGDALYVEMSADPAVGKPGGPSLDDHEQWRLANPSFPKHTPLSSMLRLRKNLKNDDSWRREGLGVWDSDTPNTLVQMPLWNRLKNTNPPHEGAIAYGVRFSPDGSRVALAVALLPEAGGPVHVEVVKVASLASGTDWLVSWLLDRWRKAAVIVVDGKAGAGDLVNTLRRQHVPARRILTPSTDEVTAAHAGWLRDVLAGNLTHLGQKGLNDSVRVAGRRRIGSAGGWGLVSVSADGDVVAAEATILARHGVTSVKVPAARGRNDRTTTSRPRTGGTNRRAVVMS
jgi:hypothetical protein